jgi:hypothetical protein
MPSRFYSSEYCSASCRFTDMNARDLRLEYERCLSSEGGFLPDTVPGPALPDVFSRFLAVIEELPNHYHGADASARAWLDREFASHDRSYDVEIDLLDGPRCDALMTVLSILCHAYRWDSAPPRPDSYALTRLELPVGLGRPWARLSERLDVPRVGNLYSMVISNWRLLDHQGSDVYRNENLTRDHLRVAHSWLRPEADHALSSFILTSIETEARGALAIRTAVELVHASEAEDAPRISRLLEQLVQEIGEMGQPFKRYIQKKNFSADQFLTLIQPTTIWALTEEGVSLEGPSGLQVGCVQVIDALLGIPSQSRLGQAFLETRRYLPKRHREFLVAFDAAAPVVRQFIQTTASPILIDQFNACIETMHLWRQMHGKRAELYLKPETPAVVQHYISTGLVVGLDDNRVETLARTMNERRTETADAALACPFRRPTS